MDAYLEEEKSLMIPLSSTAYVLSSWKTALVQADCHVSLENHFYSVPYEYVDEEVDIRASVTAVDKFYHSEKIAEYSRLRDKQRYATDASHMSPNKLPFSILKKEGLLKIAQ